MGLAVVAAILMAVMIVLGLWQLGVYDQHQHANAQAGLDRAPVPLDQVLSPDAAYPSGGVSRPVTVTGHYVAGEQIWVRGLAGAQGAYSAVTPLVTSAGSAVLVVRGSTGQTAAPVPSGAVTVTGVLEPPTARGSPLTADRVTSGINLAVLVDGFNQNLYGGYVLLRASAPPQSGALTQVTPPLPSPSRWAGIRNLLYACQWWVFAGFVAFMWWRMAREMPAAPVEDTATDQPLPLR